MNDDQVEADEVPVEMVYFWFWDGGVSGEPDDDDRRGFSDGFSMGFG